MVQGTAAPHRFASLVVPKGGGPQEETWRRGRRNRLASVALRSGRAGLQPGLEPLGSKKVAQQPTGRVPGGQRAAPDGQWPELRASLKQPASERCLLKRWQIRKIQQQQNAKRNSTERQPIKTHKKWLEIPWQLPKIHSGTLTDLHNLLSMGEVRTSHEPKPIQPNLAVLN